MPSIRVFRSSVRHCIIELPYASRKQDTLVVLGPAQPTRARLFDGRRRPPATRYDRRDKRRRRFCGGGSCPGPLSFIVAEAERDHGSLFFGLLYRSQVSFGKLNDVEGMRLRRHKGDGTISRIPEKCADVFGSSVRPLVSWSYVSRKTTFSSPNLHINRLRSS